LFFQANECNFRQLATSNYGIFLSLAGELPDFTAVMECGAVAACNGEILPGHASGDDVGGVRVATGAATACRRANPTATG